MAILLPHPTLAARGAAPELTVDLGAVASNVRAIAARTSATIMAVVKADGFGAGAADVARTALSHGASLLGVASLDEALRLRAAGLDAPILSWLNPVDLDAAAAVAAGIDLAIPSPDHLSAATVVPGARLHLHLDTGMARDGADPREWAGLCRAAALAERRGRARVVGVMGHLAHADEPGHPGNRDARDRFAWGVGIAQRWGLRPAYRHLAATAATLTDLRNHHNLVRIGAGLVGIDPSGTTPLRSPFTLTAPVALVREVTAGTAVGYGGDWVSPRATRLALVPVGYADGVPRRASGRAEVLVPDRDGPRRRPVVGRVSMDQLVVDLGPDSPVRPGDDVVLMGPGDRGEPTAAEWSAWAGVLPHEIVTGLGGRARRSVVPA